mmetsp:Transcript_83129/g.201498  ORF Transcript_83129/g.201498 Transcript_83129/m.201498 type:complete len:255 (+) Transcript_83129:1762-2526(+)
MPRQAAPLSVASTALVVRGVVAGARFQQKASSGMAPSWPHQTAAPGAPLLALPQWASQLRALAASALRMPGVAAGARFPLKASSGTAPSAPPPWTAAPPQRAAVPQPTPSAPPPRTPRRSRSGSPFLAPRWRASPAAAAPRRTRRALPAAAAPRLPPPPPRPARRPGAPGLPSRPSWQTSMPSGCTQTPRPQGRRPPRCRRFPGCTHPRSPRRMAPPAPPGPTLGPPPLAPQTGARLRAPGGWQHRLGWAPEKP